MFSHQKHVTLKQDITDSIVKTPKLPFSTINKKKYPVYPTPETSFFHSLELFPNDTMNEKERLYAMARMIFVIAMIMFLSKFVLWWLFLIIGIIITIILLKI